MSWFKPGLMDLTNSAHWMWNFEVFINELEVNFGPHDPVRDAESSLTNLTMGEDSRIVKYNVEFWKLVARLDWNESALTARYFSGLPLRIRVEILRGRKPMTLAAMRLKAQDADDIYWIGKDEAKRESRKSGTSRKKETSSTTHHSNTNASTSKPTQSSNHSDDARPGKLNKTPKCLFSTTQARGRMRGGLKSYHQRQGMSNANARDYSWGIRDIRYEIGHPKIFRVRETVSLKFGWVRFWLGLRKMVITMWSASANPTRQ
jgi:hypothetical protein